MKNNALYTIENDRIELALSGKELYGDDFTNEEIATWFKDEEDGYFNLYFGAEDAAATRNGQYEFEQLAVAHAFRWLPDKFYNNLLGVGCALGLELRPILSKSGNVTILEPSDGFATTEIDGRPVEYVKPHPSGVMPFPSETFDLIICFSVLHHIPNVSTVIREMFRVLKPGGRVLLREPTHSMGDWRTQRRGLTKRERGIPLGIFRSIVLESGFTVERESRCVFSVIARFAPLFGNPIWTYKWIVQLDRFICSIPFWSDKYHATKIWHRFRPTVVSFVLKK